MELINHTTDMWIFSKQVFSLHVYVLPISWDALHHLHWIERRRWGPCNEKKFSLLWVMSLIMVSTQCEFDFNYCLIVLKIPKNAELAIFSSGQNKQEWLDFRKSSDICIWTSSPVRELWHWDHPQYVGNRISSRFHHKSEVAPVHPTTLVLEL